MYKKETFEGYVRLNTEFFFRVKGQRILFTFKRIQHQTGGGVMSAVLFFHDSKFHRQNIK